MGQSPLRAHAAELDRRERLYRDERGAPDVRVRCVLLLDDGVATGATILAAAKALRERQPARIVIAVPVGDSNSCAQLLDVANSATHAPPRWAHGAVS